MKSKKGSNIKIMFSRPQETYVLGKYNYVLDMDFVEIKFFYKNHILELNLKIENLSKRLPQKPENSRLNHKHI